MVKQGLPEEVPLGWSSQEDRGSPEDTWKTVVQAKGARVMRWVAARKSGAEFPTLSGEIFVTNFLVVELNLTPLADWTQPRVCLEFSLTADSRYLDAQGPISNPPLCCPLGHCELSASLVWDRWHKIMCGSGKK